VNAQIYVPVELKGVLRICFSMVNGHVDLDKADGQERSHQPEISI
jgi:hypothetical protein